jgi:hypothetical protein
MGLELGLGLVPGVLVSGNAVEHYITTMLNKYGGVYWPLQELSGTNAAATASASGDFDGTTTSATVGQAGGALGKAYLFDGVNDYVDIHSSALNTLFDRSKGTLLCFAKVSGSGVWTDSATRDLVVLRADNDNRILFEKTTTNNRLILFKEFGTTVDQIAVDPITETGNFMLALTWDTSGGGELKGYLNGAQVGSTATGLGTWAGNLDATTTTIGAGSTVPTNVWDGYMAHVALLTGVMSEAELLQLAQIGRVA